MNMRTGLIGILLSIGVFFALPSLAEEPHQHEHEVPCADDGLPLGAHGKAHQCLHGAYQKLIEQFRVAELGTKNGLSDELKRGYETVFTTLQCSCSTGQCRPTEPFRWNKEKGYLEGKVDGHWVEIPEKALRRVSLKNVSEDIIAEMLKYSSAHICAITRLIEGKIEDLEEVPGKYIVECAWQFNGI